MIRSGAAALVLAALSCRAAPIPASARYPAGTPYAAREIVVDGTRLRYIATGRGPAVVLLHGLGASMYSWRHTIPPLAVAGFRVIAVDLKGFGFSDRPARGYANADYVRLTLALLDSLGIHDAVLVGNSMGGQIAIEVALARPERVRGLVLLASAGFGVRYPLLLRAARWPLVGPVATGLRNRSFTAAILRSLYADPTRVTEADVDQYFAPVAEPDYGRALRGVLREYRFDALEDRVVAVHAPTLVLWGDRDLVISPAVGRALAARFERVAFFMIAGAGHMPQEEAPDSTNPLLMAFLAEGLPRIPENLAWSTSSSRFSPSLNSRSTPPTPRRSGS
ncbi:MAG TPA: alpha/beta fold hydrolase [Gemmatimonadales bacterium]